MFEGDAPFEIELDAALFLSDDGDLSARIEAEYEVLLTQRLILQPMIELDLAASDVPELAIESGLVSLEAGLRLRYEIDRQFAPYIGWEWEEALGSTADLLEAAGEETDSNGFVFGVRMWH